MKRIISIILSIVLTLGVVYSAVDTGYAASTYDNLHFSRPYDDFYLVPAEGSAYMVTHHAWPYADMYYSQAWIVDPYDDGSESTFMIEPNTTAKGRDGSVRAQQGETVVTNIHYLQCGQPESYNVSLPQSGGSEVITLPYGYQYYQYGSLGYASCPLWLNIANITQDGNQNATVTINADKTDTFRSGNLAIKMGNTRDGSFTIANINIVQTGPSEIVSTANTYDGPVIPIKIEPSSIPQTESIIISQPEPEPTTIPQMEYLNPFGNEPPSISISPEFVIIEMGSSAKVTASLTPASAQNQAITWTSTNLSVAVVSNTGVIAGVNPGTATIIASTAQGLTAICTVTVESANFIDVSAWAIEEVALAEELGLVPDALYGTDLTKPISRAEFAAVSVKTYEALTGITAFPAVNNPFVDTNDLEVLKAYNAEISIGVSANRYEPDFLLNREQAATMLTRVFKKIFLRGWSIEADDEVVLEYVKPAPFSDDELISYWAKDSVYFMATNDIIKGTGNNQFSPRAATSEEEAMNYAIATREQALVIAVRMINKWQTAPASYSDSSITAGLESSAFFDENFIDKQ